MLRGAIEYTSRSPFVHIDGTVDSARYISGMFPPVALPFVPVLRNNTFKQDNARLHVTGIVGPSLTRKMFFCCSGQHIYDIFHQHKTSSIWLPRDWLVTIHQSLKLMSCGIVL
ncbi:transposable element Tcb1 transposase [Trichonephila clavipes]|nr:transposable element Tcb1 transposase [Trichonephila clavipes]